MIAHDFQTVQNTFTKCFKDSAVFRRPDSHENYFDVNIFHKDNKQWLVVAAGIDKSEANVFFRGNPKRAEKATAPILSRDSCEISVLFIARPLREDPVNNSPLSLIVPFAPKQGIPWLELREAYLRIWNIPEKNQHGLNNLRWEWDIKDSKENPFESGLNEWKDELGFNPAHPPSHLHINTDRINAGNKSSFRPGDKVDELRLAFGKPNPLALILSIAVWLRNL